MQEYLTKKGRQSMIGKYKVESLILISSIVFFHKGEAYPFMDEEITHLQYQENILEAH